MKKYNQYPQRKPIRLKGYDYSHPGLYFITIVTENHKNLFGEINNKQMKLNNAGKMIKQLWLDIQNDFPHTKLHEYITMPNHIHGIIEIISAHNTDSILNRAEIDSAPTVTGIPQIIQSFKRHTTIKYIEMVKQNKLPPFNKRIWQRNYWDYIIRNNNEYQHIAKYIIENTQKWENDKLNGGNGNIVLETQAEYNSEIWMV